MIPSMFISVSVLLWFLHFHVDFNVVHMVLVCIFFFRLPTRDLVFTRIQNNANIAWRSFCAKHSTWRSCSPRSEVHPTSACPASKNSGAGGHAVSGSQLESLEFWKLAYRGRICSRIYSRGPLAPFSHTKSMHGLGKKNLGHLSFECCRFLVPLNPKLDEDATDLFAFRRDENIKFLPSSTTGKDWTPVLIAVALIAANI